MNHHRTFLWTTGLIWALLLMPMCMSAGFDENCDNSANLCTGDLICSGTTNRCECEAGFNYIQDRCIETPFGGRCTQDSDCPPGAQCLDEGGKRTGTLACVTRPHALQSVHMRQYLDEAMNVIINITWVPGLYTGPTFFEVTAVGRDYFNEKYTFDVAVFTALGATTEELKDNVHAGLLYRVSVTPRTGAGYGPEYSLGNIVTLNSKPGFVQNLAVLQNGQLANEMTLTFDCPSISERGGNITAFIIRKVITTGGGAISTDHTIPHNFVAGDCSLKINASQVGGIEVLNNYTFEVKVKNKDFEGDFTSPVKLFTNARPPYTSATESFDILLSPFEDSKLEQSSAFEVQLCSSCFADPTQGPIRSAAMVICIKSDFQSCSGSFTQPNPENTDKNRFTKTIDSFDDINMYDTWATAKANNFAMAYRTTPNDWVERLRRAVETWLQQDNICADLCTTCILPDNSTSFVYAIGIDSNCDENDNTTFCNGPLPKGKSFVVSVVVCNDAGCDETTSLNDNFKTKVKDDDDGDDDATIIGLAVALGLVALVCICLVAVVVFTRCKDGSMVV